MYYRNESKEVIVYLNTRNIFFKNMNKRALEESVETWSQHHHPNEAASAEGHHRKIARRNNDTKSIGTTVTSTTTGNKNSDSTTKSESVSMQLDKTTTTTTKIKEQIMVVPRPYPFFFYMDYSTTPDPNPMIPLTSPGNVPNFPAKMHSILSRRDLQDIVSWMPHGRSWRVHKPREFEARVIPQYFEHVKNSSFIRQANGWGFHRLTVDSRDRNSYYHPLFLRALPHLCKRMKRPGTSKKQPIEPEHEPNLYEISRLHPLPILNLHEAAHCLLLNVPGGSRPIGIDLAYCAGVKRSTIGQQEQLYTLNQGGHRNPRLTPQETASLGTFHETIKSTEIQMNLYANSMEHFRRLVQADENKLNANSGTGKTIMQGKMMLNGEPSVPSDNSSSFWNSLKTNENTVKPLSALSFANHLAFDPSNYYQQHNDEQQQQQQQYQNRYQLSRDHSLRFDYHEMDIDDQGAGTLMSFDPNKIFESDFDDTLQSSNHPLSSSSSQPYCTDLYHDMLI